MTHYNKLIALTAVNHSQTDLIFLIQRYTIWDSELLYKIVKSDISF